MTVLSMPAVNSDTQSPEVQHLQNVLQAQKAAYARHPYPSAAERIDRLTRVRRMLVKYEVEIAEAVSEDYGNRSMFETRLGEILPCIELTRYYEKHITQWIKPQKRHIAALFRPASGAVVYQPLGVVGIVAPWNYPVLMTMAPLICAIAAGNHVIVKTSSFSGNMAKVMQRGLGEYFPDDVIAIISGSGEVTSKFSTLPFDQLTFTGSTEVGRTIMREAAANLTPVLLELGGKSPLIIHESMPMKDAAERLTFGKCFNAGQTCIAPDYAFVKRGKADELVQHMQSFVRRFYPSLRDNQDYSCIINDKQYRRLQGYLEDAASKGATVHSFNSANEDLEASRKIAPTIITNVTDDMLVSQHELFGPILVVREYDDIDECLEYINARPHPLALYYFDYDIKRSDYIRDRTHSGHFGVNQLLTHGAQEDLPFGGVGNSGMGKYHGFEGFQSMSNARSVMVANRLFTLRVAMPPYGNPLHKLLFKAKIR